MAKAQDDLVLVTGASGFVGSHITRLLVGRGRQVRVMLRPTSNRAALEGLDVEVFTGDALDPASLRQAMAGCHTVFHCVVDARVWLDDPAPMRRNNIDGLCNAMDAALSCGIERFIFTSTMGTLGLNRDGPVTEDIEFNWRESAPPYILARLEAEELFMSYCRDRGLPGVALCVANTYGPQDFQPTPHNGILWQVASGKRTAMLDAAQPTVDIRDVAEAALLAEQNGRTGERYIIANEFVTSEKFYGLATARLGNPPPRLIGYRTAYAIAWLFYRIARLRGVKDAMMRPEAVYLAQVFREMDHSKAERELGWHPRPVEATVNDAVDWFAARDAAEGAVGKDDMSQPSAAARLTQGQEGASDPGMVPGR